MTVARHLLRESAKLHWFNCDRDREEMIDKSINVLVAAKIWGKYVALTLLLTACYCLIWVWQGVDLTDQGYHLSTQYGLLHGKESGGLGQLIYLSNVVGMLWMCLGGEGGLLWARLGWVAVVVVTSVAAFVTLACCYGPREAFIANILSLPVCLAWGLMLIDYDTVPAAIFVFVVLLQVAGWQCLSRPAIASSCFFLSGALIPLCVFAKITYVLGCLYVCTPVVVSFCYVDVGKREAACTFSLMVAGSIAGGMVVAAILLSRGGLLEYVNVVRQIVDGNALTAKHSSVSLVGEFCHQLVAILKRMPILASVLVVSLVVFLRASSRFSTRVGFVSVLLLIGLACFAFCSLKSSVIARSEHAYFLTGGLGLGALWVLAQWYLYGKSAGKITPGEVTLFAGALFAVLLGPLGSDKVFLKVGSGAWLLVPVVFLEIGRSLTRTLSFEADCYVSRSSVFALALISAFAGISVLVRSVSVHKDSQSRVDMVAAISHNKLRGVYTTVERARVLQGLLDELKSHVSEGDEMIAFRSTPMVNFLTGTVTPLSSAWPEIMPHAMLERDLSDLASTGNMPKVAVAALVNPVDRDWEARTPISFTGQSAIIADFLSEFNYRVVWQNKCFVIYRRP